MKGIKTTIVAVIALAIIIALIIALFLDKIEAEDLFNGIASVGAGAGVFIGLFSKDATASHTIDTQSSGGHPNPDHEEH